MDFLSGDFDPKRRDLCMVCKGGGSVAWCHTHKWPKNCKLKKQMHRKPKYTSQMIDIPAIFVLDRVLYFFWRITQCYVGPSLEGCTRNWNHCVVFLCFWWPEYYFWGNLAQSFGGIYQVLIPAIVIFGQTGAIKHPQNT